MSFTIPIPISGVLSHTTRSPITTNLILRSHWHSPFRLLPHRWVTQQVLAQLEKNSTQQFPRASHASHQVAHRISGEPSQIVIRCKGDARPAIWQTRAPLVRGLSSLAGGGLFQPVS